MRVAVAGAHGQIARLLSRRLVAAGHEVGGLIRNPDHSADVAGDGATPILCDLEQVAEDELARLITGYDAAVFAAGAGPGSGPERKLALDRDGSNKLLSASRSAGVSRYVIVSAVGAESPPAGDEVFAVYLRAKAEADAAVQASDREWTIVRPGGLTNDPGTGRVRVQADPFRGQVPREDVAALLELILEEPRSSGAVLYVNGGDTPLAEALEQAIGS